MTEANQRAKLTRPSDIRVLKSYHGEVHTYFPVRKSVLLFIAVLEDESKKTVSIDPLDIIGEGAAIDQRHRHSSRQAQYVIPEEEWKILSRKYAGNMAVN